MNRLHEALIACWWFLLLAGMITQNPWVFGPAAFFLLLDKIGER